MAGAAVKGAVVGATVFGLAARQDRLQVEKAEVKGRTGTAGMNADCMLREKKLVVLLY